MSEDLESRLRAALRPVAPRDEFTETLVARVSEDRHLHANNRSLARQRLKTPVWWLTAGVAASLLIAAGVQHHLQEQRDRESGLEARRQVIEALRMTSRKLDLAYEMVKSQSSSLADDKPGV